MILMECCVSDSVCEGSSSAPYILVGVVFGVFIIVVILEAFGYGGPGDPTSM